MANCDDLFKRFNGTEGIQITQTKNDSLKTSRKNLRKRIKQYFSDNHSDYKPSFYTQGSFRMKTAIKTKDDTCDLDDGVYFKDNPDNESSITLQQWVKDAADGTTDATPKHNKKCITVDYKAGYNIDLPIFLFDESIHQHPSLAVKDGSWLDDDPKEFIEEFKRQSDSKGQLIRIVRYLKAWCNFKGINMPSGLAMTILAMNNLQKNDRDDVSLKYTLIEMERKLKFEFKCKMPTTPQNDIFKEYKDERRDNFLNNLSSFIKDAKEAVDNEKNQLKASELWQKHLGDRFPDGEDKDETSINTNLLSSVIGTAKPYFKKL